MKKLIYVFATLFIVSCSQDQEGNSISVLKAEKDSLILIHKTIGDRIAEIDAQIQLENPDKKLTQVSSYSVNKGSFSHFVEVYGNVESEQVVSMLPETMGNIDRILVQEGQEVSKGQLLVQLNGDVLRNRLKELDTNYELANTIYEKQKSLWEKNIGSEVQLLEAKARKESLESSKKSLQSQIELTEIRAPYDGMVDEIFGKVGEMAMPQMPVVRIINLTDVYIEAEVSEAYLPTIKKGTVAMVEFTSLNKTLKTTVGQVGKFINPNNRTFKVKIDLPKTDFNLNPNLLAKIKVKDFEVLDSAVSIPTRMIQQTPQGEDYVMMVVSNGGIATVQKKMIKAGISYDGMTLVSKGISDGDILIDKGARSVKDGQEVEVK